MTCLVDGQNGLRDELGAVVFPSGAAVWIYYFYRSLCVETDGEQLLRLMGVFLKLGWKAVYMIETHGEGLAQQTFTHTHKHTHAYVCLVNLAGVREKVLPDLLPDACLHPD